MLALESSINDMNKTVLGLMVVVVLAAGGWYFYSQKDATMESTNDSSIMADGDEGGPGSVKPDTSLVVYESIQGKWQSNEDPKSAREFKDDGSVVDIYDGKVVSTGTYSAFVKTNAPAGITLPLEDSAVYIQIKDASTSLMFKLAKLTPEELELIYMDRGGMLTYKLVK